jgi:hypothetical protein
MSYGPDDIATLSVDEAIQKRPGMYLGDIRALGAARLVSMAADVLVALTVNRDRRLSFSHHAFVDVSICGRNASVIIDYHPDECPDIVDRCAYLEEGRGKLRPDKYALGQEPSAVAPMPILSALTSDLCIFRSSGKDIEPVLGSFQREARAPTNLNKGAFVGAHFHIKEIIETDELTHDYLEGFLQGSQRVPSLIVREVEVNQTP